MKENAMSNSDDTFGMRLALNDLSHITRTLHGSGEPQASGEAEREEADSKADPAGE